MTENVLVYIKGLHAVAESPEEEIEVIFPGTCRNVQGTWYIRYEEIIEGMTEKIKNMIKLRPDSAEVVKRGLINSQMIFEKGKKTQTWYETPLGGVRLGIVTTHIDLKETEDELNAQIFYALELNEDQMTDCKISVRVTAQKTGLQ